jgi:hypothetical protein
VRERVRLQRILLEPPAAPDPSRSRTRSPLRRKQEGRPRHLLRAKARFRRAFLRRNSWEGEGRGGVSSRRQEPARRKVVEKQEDKRLHSREEDNLERERDGGMENDDRDDEQTGEFRVKSRQDGVDIAYPERREGEPRE